MSAKLDVPLLCITAPMDSIIPTFKRPYFNVQYKQYTG